MLVIAVGVVGVAALYSDPGQASPQSQLQRRAGALAERIAARIAARPVGRDGYATTVGVLCDPQSRPALPQDEAAQEAACWSDEVERELPSGLGSISRDPSTNPPSYVVAVSWAAPQSGAASYVIRVSPERPPEASQRAARAAD